ncbi:hypothetical protein LTR86_003313 [Recurvomyces mirabilis]|nr:hypothetical protein LTR86_003313 [Recurvomyces mirabilis]
MRVSAGLNVLVGAAAARSIASESSEQTPIQDADYKVPTIHESTVMARRIMHLSTLGTLTTTFPEQSGSRDSASSYEHGELSAFENRPEEMAGSPIGLMEYYADCEPLTGDPTLLAINIATPYKNYAAGSNISLAIRWWPISKNTYTASLSPLDPEDDEEIPTPHTPAALPRFSLHGYLEPISAKDLAVGLIPACFLQQHPDSIYWQPGNDIHTSQYMRLVVEHIYWFGGFGDRARIGWLPIDEWKNVTMGEVASARLPDAKEKEAEWLDRLGTLVGDW